VAFATKISEDLTQTHPAIGDARRTPVYLP